MARIKSWPNKENITVDLEIEIDNVSVNVELDLESAAEVLEDLGDAIRIVQEDWIV